MPFGLWIINMKDLSVRLIFKIIYTFIDKCKFKKY